jgi:NADP-dependent alcohol dehydrogenase
MLNFTFKNTTEILFGEKQIQAVKSRLPENAKVLFLYGGGSIKKNGVYADVLSVLEGRQFTEFSGVEPNPSFENLMQAVDVVKRQDINFILAVGGGSVIDGAKFIAAACLMQDDPWTLLTGENEVRQALPIGAVLTLPATGSESNGNAVVTRKSSQQKKAFSSTLVQPVFAVLDPSYTYSLPVRQVGNGVVDAFVHTIEQYLTYPVNAPLQDRFAEGILSTLLEEGPKALSNPTDYNVRANVMWSATMALNGLIGKGVPQDWATHMIGHELTALYNLDHAQTLAIVLPHLMQVQRLQKREKLIQLGKRVYGINAGTDDEIVEQCIKCTQQFFEDMGVPTHLRDYGLGADDGKAAIENLKRNGLKALGEHGDITPNVASRILELAL